MKRLSEYIFGLQPGERGTALLLAGYHFLLLLCLYLLKPVRDGLFLTERGTTELPLVFLLVAAATIPASLFQRRLGQHFQSDRLTNRLMLGHVATLVGVGSLALAGVSWSAYAMYVYVSIYGVLATSQFWLFAGSLLTSAQSKRTFAVLNLGGILGAVVGGELTGGLLDGGVGSPLVLLGLAALLLTSTIPLVVWIRRYHSSEAPAEVSADATPDASDASGASEAPDPTDAKHPLADHPIRKILSDNPLVGWIAALVALISIASALMDYQLKTIALQTFAGEVELTAFLGRFYGRVSLVALVLQFALSTGLRRYVRSTSSLWMLPLAIALGSTAVLLVPGLLAVTFLRGADQSLKHSVDKTARELLYLPLSQAVKRRIKVPLDLVVDQVAYGAGGLLLLGLTTGLGMGPVELSPVVLGIAGLWMGVVVKTRQQYLRQFRQSLKGALRRQPQAAETANASASKTEPDAEAPSPPPALREDAMRKIGAYIALSQALGIKTGASVPEGVAVKPSDLPAEATLRARRQEALDAVFDVLGTWIPAVQQTDSDDLSLALNALHHPSSDVRGDAVSFLDGLLSGEIRRLLVPVLDDPDGQRALKDAPALYRVALDDLTPSLASPSDGALPSDAPSSTPPAPDSCPRAAEATRSSRSASSRPLARETA